MKHTALTICKVIAGLSLLIAIVFAAHWVRLGTIDAENLALWFRAEVFIAGISIPLGYVISKVTR